MPSESVPRLIVIENRETEAIIDESHVVGYFLEVPESDYLFAIFTAVNYVQCWFFRDDKCFVIPLFEYQLSELHLVNQLWVGNREMFEATGRHTGESRYPPIVNKLVFFYNPIELDESLFG